jgi:hypothetical protein
VSKSTKAEADPTKRELRAGLKRLEAAVTEQRDTEEAPVAQAKAALQPIVDRARSMVAEIDAFEQQYGQEIQALCRFDYRRLMGRVSYSRLERTERLAREIRDYMGNRLALRAIPARVELLDLQAIKEKKPMYIRHVVEQHPDSPASVLREKLERLRAEVQEIRRRVERTEPVTVERLSVPPGDEPGVPVVSDFDPLAS